MAPAWKSWPDFRAGFGSSAILRTTRIHQYCDVTGYVAPQNKFALKLPLPGDWNQKFLFIACGGFCGRVDGAYCNLGLARGYASASGNGGHDGAWAFDGTWAANAPELQEDFACGPHCGLFVDRIYAKALHFLAEPVHLDAAWAEPSAIDGTLIQEIAHSE